MPSPLHEALVSLFRNRPALAPELLHEALHLELPAHTEVRLGATDLTDLQPAEYRADLVVLLYDGTPALGIVVEVQLQIDERKLYTWPVYVAGLRARMSCPVCLLVISPREAVARWAREPNDLGGGNRFHALVIGPSGVPEITDEERARADPELAVLSAMAHGGDADPEKALRIAGAAIAASVGLDADRSTLYFDLVVASLGEAARKSLQAMNRAKYEYQSDFARQYFSEGKAEGQAEGRAVIVAKLLALKFGALAPSVTERLQKATAAELDLWAERILSADTLEGVFA